MAGPIIDISTRKPLVVSDEENEVLLLPTPEAILRVCLTTADSIDQILVLTIDKEGVMGFVGNCEGLAESMLFMDLIKAQALFGRVEGPGEGGIA